MDKGTRLVACIYGALALGCGDDGATVRDAGQDTSADTRSDGTPFDAGGTESAWTWIRVDDDGVKPALRIDGSDTVHIAYILEANDGWIRHAIVGPGVTDPIPTTVAEGYFYGPIDVGALSDGRAVVAFHNHDAQDQSLGIEQEDGSFVVSNMETFPGHDGWYNALTVDEDDVVHTASYDPRDAPTSEPHTPEGVLYGRYADGWVIENVAPGSFDYAGGMSIVKNDAGSIYIAFFDDGAGEARIAERGGSGEWAVTTIEPKGDSLERGRFPVALWHDGELRIVYLARNTESTGTIRLARGLPGSFAVSDLVSVADLEIGFFGARNVASLAVTPSGRVVVAVQTMRALWVMIEQEDGSFAREDVQAAPAGVSFGQHTTLQSDADGRLHLAYFECAAESCNGSPAHTIRYGYREAL